MCAHLLQLVELVESFFKLADCSAVCIRWLGTGLLFGLSHLILGNEDGALLLLVPSLLALLLQSIGQRSWKELVTSLESQEHRACVK